MTACHHLCLLKALFPTSLKYEDADITGWLLMTACQQYCTALQHFSSLFVDPGRCYSFQALPVALIELSSKF